MESDRLDEHALTGPPTSESQEGLVLPPIADKADDLEAIRKAVEVAAAVSGGLWPSEVRISEIQERFFAE
jgi:hypothetical protein